MPKRTRSDGSPQTPKLLRRDSFGPESGVEPHTLICGTFPSDKSLGAGEYYANRESTLRLLASVLAILIDACTAAHRLGDSNQQPDPPTVGDG